MEQLQKPDSARLISKGSEMVKLQNYLDMINDSNTIEEKLSFARQTLDEAKEIKDPRDRKKVLVRIIRELPKTPAFLPLYQLDLDLANNIEHAAERRYAILDIVKELPKTKNFIPLYLQVIRLAIETTKEIEEPKHRKSILSHLVNELPQVPESLQIYKQAMEQAVEAASMIKNAFIRKYSLVDIANELPETDEFIPLRLHALRLAMDLAEGPHYKKYSLVEIAKELPKSSDYAFYRKYSLLGIAKSIPKTGEFLKLYKDAIKLAMTATDYLDEPHYQKYALVYIAKELPRTEELMPLYSQVMMHAYESSLKIKDPIVKKHALIEILRELPKTEEYFPLITKIIEHILSFFTVKKRIEDIEIVDVMDYLLVAEEKRMKESKKNRYIKEKYANILARELDKFGFQLKDIRLIEILRPYTHVWIQPNKLRAAVKKIVDHLEKLKETYHGKEVERPVLVEHVFVKTGKQVELKRPAKSVEDCLSIDLGATNTVIMRKRGGYQPEFVVLKSISGNYEGVNIIPTKVSAKTNTIGMEAKDLETVVNFKKMLLDGRTEGKRFMESYFNILYRHLKNDLKRPQWFSIFSGALKEKLYVTVPVGFHDYRRNIKQIIAKTMKGMDVELLEEPLAAAIGYQVAGVRDKIVMVIDFGGCTLDVMILRLSLDDVHVISKPDRSKVLGGHDIDAWLADYLVDKVGKTSTIDKRVLINKAEEIKIALSDSVKVPFRWNGDNICEVTREDLEDVLAKHNFYRMVDRTISNVLRKAEKIAITKDKIEAIILTGGSSQIPSFKDKIGSIVPELMGKNAIYDHSPLSAVAAGAVLYSTRNIIDKHLGLAYALRYTTKNKDIPYAYEIVFEKGELFPFEKTYKLSPARTLGDQNEIYLELFEIPDSHILRRWENEDGTEFIKQALKYTEDMALKGFNIVTLSFQKPLKEYVYVTFCVDNTGHLGVRYGNNDEIDTGIRLQ